MGDYISKLIKEAYPYEVDLSNCDKEPLHHIQVVQGYASIIACHSETGIIEFVSDNLEKLAGIPAAHALGKHYREVIGEESYLSLEASLGKQATPSTPQCITAYFQIGDKLEVRNIITHENDGWKILEIEPVSAFFTLSEFQHRLNRSVQRIQRHHDSAELFQDVSEELKSLTGYDRVMVYKFDEEYNGRVIAECCNPDMEPFLDLHYPHTDIPRQARDLFLANQVRLIGSTTEVPSKILSHSDKKQHKLLDLTYCNNRGTSPIHLEYLSNMGVEATMSVAIIYENRLWGLFACHHHEPRFLDYNIRMFIRFVGQIVSGHLSLQESDRYRRRILNINLVRSLLFDQINSFSNVAEGLTAGKYSLLDMVTDTSGVVVHSDNQYVALGQAPSEDEVSNLVDWINLQGESEVIFTSNQLIKDYPPAEKFKDKAAGIMYVSLNHPGKDYILWFRPEIIETIRWGGKPEKIAVQTEDGKIRMSPRKSFATYAEAVRGRSLKWEEHQIDAALSLRNHIKNVIVQKIDEIRQTNAELKSAYREIESFSYTVSHDLRAPLRSIDGYAQILREDFAKKLGEEGLQMLDVIQDSTQRMNTFIDEVLHFSKVGSQALDRIKLPFATIVQDVLRDYTVSLKKIGGEVKLMENLPLVQVDVKLVRMLLSNLVGNSIKYRRKDIPLRIQIGYITGKAVDPQHPIFYVQDNGIGFKQKLADRIFEPFSRLVLPEEVEGSGIGLAIVKKVVDKHNGSIQVKAKPGAGAAFYFSLSAPFDTLTV